MADSKTHTPLPVTIIATTPQKTLRHAEGARRMELPGFDDDFIDFPDYIFRITDRIWHQSRVELCRVYYRADCVMHTQAGDSHGVDSIITGTQNTMASFPDRRLDADAVIWSDEGDGVFYSSHLITSKMTHLGAGEFGAPTGKRVRVHTIAGCLCRENQIYEEWLVRDNAGLVQQLGLDVREVARAGAQADKEAGFDLYAFHKPALDELLSAPAPDITAPNGLTSREAHAKAALHRVFESEDDYMGDYDERARIRRAPLLELYGADDLRRFNEARAQTLQPRRLLIDHYAETSFHGEIYDVAMRWRLVAQHCKTNMPVLIFGITHWRMLDGLVIEDITLWDELAVQRMIIGMQNA